MSAGSCRHLRLLAVCGAALVGLGPGAALAATEGEPDAVLGERLLFTGFSFQPPADYEGPALKRQPPATYLAWTGPKRLDGSQPLFQLTVTDIASAPKWTGYDRMTLGQLTDYFVQEIARTGIGFKTGAMEEVSVHGISFRRVPWSCQIKNNAMELASIRGWVMATRHDGLLYVLTARDTAGGAAASLPVMSRAAASFRWEEKPEQPPAQP